MKKQNKQAKPDRLMKSFEKITITFTVLSLMANFFFNLGMTGQVVSTVTRQTYSSGLVLITLLWLILYLFVKNINDKYSGEKAEIINTHHKEFKDTKKRKR